MHCPPLQTPVPLQLVPSVFRVQVQLWLELVQVPLLHVYTVLVPVPEVAQTSEYEQLPQAVSDWHVTPSVLRVHVHDCVELTQLPPLQVYTVLLPVPDVAQVLAKLQLPHAVSDWQVTPSVLRVHVHDCVELMQLPPLQV